MKNKQRYTTVSLDDNQYLCPQYSSSIVESYCIGYTGGKRDKTITGNYFTKELIKIDKQGRTEKEAFNHKNRMFS